MPVPPRGVTRCAASPTRNTGPHGNASASWAANVNVPMRSMRGVRPAYPAPSRISRVNRSAVKSSGPSRSASYRTAYSQRSSAAGGEEGARALGVVDAVDAVSAGRRATPTAARGTGPWPRRRGGLGRASGGRRRAGPHCARRRPRRGRRRPRHASRRSRRRVASPVRRPFRRGHQPPLCRVRPSRAGSACRWASSTGSRWSCGTHAGPVGLSTAACSRVG